MSQFLRDSGVVQGVDERRGRVMILKLNYLTSEEVVPTMSSSVSGGGPDACGIMANLWSLMQSVMDESAPALEGLGLSTKAFFLLSMVEDVPFPAELARMMHLPPPTVTYLIKQLEALGLIKRRAEPGDLRKFRLVLTAAGKRAIGQGGEAIGVVAARRLSRIAPEEVAVFDRIVSALAGDTCLGS
jgi:DNA-binding MarR family transcriptional regulator